MDDEALLAAEELGGWELGAPAVIPELPPGAEDVFPEDDDAP